MNEYQEQAIAFARFKPEYRLLYPALALAEEAGEVSGKVAKLLRDKNGIIDDEFITMIEKELGDVLWNVAALAASLGLKMQDIADTNISKLTDRQNRGVLRGSGDNR